MPALRQTSDVLTAGPGGVNGAVHRRDATHWSVCPPACSSAWPIKPFSLQLVVIDHLPGDYNKNGVVDTADYVVWRKTLGQAAAYFSGADGNGNSKVRRWRLQLLASQLRRDGRRWPKCRYEYGHS